MARSRSRFQTRFDSSFHENVVKSLFSNGIAGQGTVGDLHGLFAGSLGLYAGMQETESLIDPMIQEPWFAASVNLLAGTVAKVPLLLYEEDPTVNKNAQVLAAGHPVRQLFDFVSAELSPAELRKHDAVNMSLSGESIWLLADLEGNPVESVGLFMDAFIDLPAQIIPVRGDMVREVRDPATRKIVAFRVPTSNGRGYRQWPAGSVILHHEIPDHRRPGRGLSRAAQVWGSATASFLARRYNTIWLGNLGDPGGVLTVDGWLSDENYNRLQTRIDDEWNNKERAGEVRLIEGGAQFTANTAKPKDMGFEHLLDHNRSEITAVTGTPGGLLTVEVENYATFRGNMRVYVVLREQPFSGSIADKLNSSFFPRLRKPEWQRIRARFDRTALLKMLGDAKEQGEGAVALTRAGMAPNLAIKHAGVPVEDGDLHPAGDEPYISKGLVPMASQSAAERTRVLEQVGKSLKALTDARVSDDVAVRLVSEAAGIESLGTLEEKQAPPAIDPATGKVTAPGAGGADDGEVDEDEPDDDKKKAAKPSVVVTRAAPSRRELTRIWNAWERTIRPRRNALSRALRSKLWAMRAAQVAAIAHFVETGEFPEKSVGAVKPVGFVARATLEQIERAAAGDDLEVAALAAMDENPLVVRYLGCGGEVREVHREYTPRLDVVLRRHERLRELGVDRVRSLPLIQRQGISESELDRLVIVASEKFQAEIAGLIAENTLAAWEAGASFTSAELGVAILESTPPEVVAALRDRAIKLAGDTTGQLADRIRLRISQALAGADGATGSLIQQLTAALDEVKAGTTGAFNSHRARAQAIAHTETAGAANTARFDAQATAYRDGVVTVLRWVTSGRGEAPEGTVRSSHFRIEANEEAVAPGQTFSNGLRFPLDPEATEAKEVVNCQCTTVAETAD